jgi:putative ABC transport system permease protein
MAGLYEHLLRYKDKSLYEKDAVFADSTFFDVFNFHFVGGNAATALSESYSVVLSSSTADRLFGKEDPIGKVIDIESNGTKGDYKVTGVIDESLGKSHIQANFFMTMNSGGIGNWVMSKVNNEWAGADVVASYIRLQPHANAAALESKLSAFLDKYGGEELKKMGKTKQLHLQPVSSIHTTTGYTNEFSKTVNPFFLKVLLLIAAMIQLIACINFMNLSTARAARRAKEVGVRKVIGAGRGALIRQFLGESMLLALISVLLAIPVLVLVLPYLNQLTHGDVHLSFLSDYRLWSLLTGLVLFTGLIAGSYPAFYLSAFQAAKVIKGNFSNQISAAGVRRSLVVFQFVLSIVLIIGIIVIYTQTSFIKNKDLGFDKEQKLLFTFNTKVDETRITSFVNDLRALADVGTVSLADNYPGRFASKHDRIFSLAGGTVSQVAPFIQTDEYYTRALGIQVISGREFRQNDTGKVLINEAMARSLGLDIMKAPGVRLYTERSYEIAGVVRDFNFNSLHEAVKPILIMYGRREQLLSHIITSIHTGNISGMLGRIEAAWNKDLPGLPFEYAFLDARIQQQYEAETTLTAIINSFTVVAILISCLGLFGLSAFSAEQRNKEIGIRKVLGSSVPGLVGLLSKDFLKLVGIAIFIATPLGWWVMQSWLQAFAYRVDISWWMFALAGGVAFVIALATVSFHAIRAALTNPVRSLRAE